MPYNELKQILKAEFADLYLDEDKWPKAYCGSGKIRAIVLGADPSNRSDQRFAYAFGLEDHNSQYFSLIKANLDVIGVELDEIFVQNVCRNYFVRETSKLPPRTWLRAASHWIPYLKEELDSHPQLSVDTPVLVTAEIILKALAPDVHTWRTRNVDYYRNCTFIEPNQNLLERKLIPLYRHQDYALGNWGDYAEAVVKALRRS
ncbi:MAG: hypothetical protein ACE3NC_06745 [Candidatus Wallacebacter cryptica]